MMNKLRKISQFLNKPRKHLLKIVIPIIVLIGLTIVTFGVYQLNRQHDDRDKFISALYEISRMEPSSILIMLNIKSPQNRSCITIDNIAALHNVMHLLGNAGGRHYESHAKLMEEFKLVLTMTDGKQYQFLGKIYQDSPEDAFVIRKFLYEDEKETLTSHVDMPPRIKGLGTWVLNTFKEMESVPCLSTTNRVSV